MRRVKRFTTEFVKGRDRFARSAGRSSRIDETYVRIRGKRVCLYRAVHRAGKTVDFLLSLQSPVTKLFRSTTLNASPPLFSHSQHSETPTLDEQYD
ncbi:DDE-type integrase/transposase/recombinase [Paraburkholderia sp. BCC1886]|uniref:DDE-type integrase/transposase/recombinase n=1 Tax=Paraburkholderia sp. BCC1886 TaxID=2562670 RepID=UPI0028CB3633|nr:DDE-type integrase/transposase/recombinase [Paraburkholderia sp. BCC1886]